MFSDSELSKNSGWCVQIGLAACRVGQSMRLGGILEKLGRKHVDYGATLETYGVVKDAFMWVINKALGESSRLAGLNLLVGFGALYKNIWMFCCLGSGRVIGDEDCTFTGPVADPSFDVEAVRSSLFCIPSPPQYKPDGA